VSKLFHERAHGWSAGLLLYFQHEAGGISKIFDSWALAMYF